MAGNDKKTKAAPPKAEPAKMSVAKEAVSKEAAPKADAAASVDAPAKTEATSEAAPDAAADATPSNYSRGEGQKTVTKAYRDNWQAIFGDKKKR